jgi:acetyl esterase/lipase
MNNNFSKIHPALLQIAKRSPKFDFNKNNLWLMRGLMSLMPVAKIPKSVSIANIFIVTESGQPKIRLRVYTPKMATAPTPLLIWMHGGGYVVGKPEQDDGLCAYYAKELGITVFSVEYRYAPRYPFPIGLEDCYAAVKWVVSHAREQGIDYNRIAIGGASAGGGLAAALVQLVHDRQEFKVAVQLLVYPMLDDRTALRAEIDDRQNVTWTQKSNRFGWESYLGTPCGAKSTPEYAVPARREDLSGLPPAWIGVGNLDVFYDEDVLYAKRLQSFGTECELVVVEGAFHGFDVFDPRILLVQEFRNSQIAALKKHLFAPSALG